MENKEFSEDLCNEKHEVLNVRMNKMEQQLEQIRDRPSWLVVLIISGLGTSCGALLMYIIAHGPR